MHNFFLFLSFWRVDAVRARKLDEFLLVVGHVQRRKESSYSDSFHDLEQVYLVVKLLSRHIKVPQLPRLLSFAAAAKVSHHEESPSLASNLQK